MGAGPRIQSRRGDRSVAPVLAALLAPATVMASTLAVWRLLADLSVTQEFAISNGLFSHWQVWVATAGLLHLATRRLGRHTAPSRTASSARSRP
jgi:hypothetical protein